MVFLFFGNLYIYVRKSEADKLPNDIAHTTLYKEKML